MKRTEKNKPSKFKKPYQRHTWASLAGWPGASIFDIDKRWHPTLASIPASSCDLDASAQVAAGVTVIVRGEIGDAN